MTHFYTFIGLLLCSWAYLAYGIDNNPIQFSHPQQEQRYETLIEELRCVVCQNQSVADSNAELAQDVRNLVRQKIIAGESNQQISAFLVERYGDFVLYKPPLKPATYVLWLGPLLLAILALGLLIYFIRRHAQLTAQPNSLTTEEQNKLAKLLNENKD